MNSLKPYYIRALHEWISDNDCTPLILVSSKSQDIQMPAGIEENGKAILNISFGATKNLELINEGILFDARFSGISQSLYIPIESILAIYARENGQGMMFNKDEDTPTPDKPPETKSDSKNIKKFDNSKKDTGKSFLKVVK